MGALRVRRRQWLCKAPPPRSCRFCDTASPPTSPAYAPVGQQVWVRIRGGSPCTVQFGQPDKLLDGMRIAVLRELPIRECVRREQRLDNARLEGELHGIAGQVIGSVPLPLVEQGLRLRQSLVGHFLELSLGHNQPAQFEDPPRLATFLILTECRSFCSQGCATPRPDQEDAKGHPRFLGGGTRVAPFALNSSRSSEGLLLSSP